MISLSPEQADFSEAWIDGDRAARWRSSAGHGPGVGAAASGSSLIEVGPGCRLPRHTDSAEETIVVTAGMAEVRVDGSREQVPAGGIAVVAAEQPHEVHCAGDRTLTFVAVYAAPDVVTGFEEEVQPGGSRERRPVA